MQICSCTVPQLFEAFVKPLFVIMQQEPFSTCVFYQCVCVWCVCGLSTLSDVSFDPPIMSVLHDSPKVHGFNNLSQ